jgi:acetylornithine deacetylase
VSLESISDHEHSIGKWLATYLSAHNFSVEMQRVGSDDGGSDSGGSSKRKRYNVLAHPPHKRSTGILLTSHIDTVPPFIPYYYNESSGVIGGRGSVDAKASVAAQIVAVQGLRDAQPQLADEISLLFVVGEETGGDGMRAFSSGPDRPSPNYDVAIFGEPTEGKLVCGHKGMLGFHIHVKGKAAHSGYPWLGVSANDVLVEALGRLLELRQHLPWSDKYGNTTMNFGRVEGGVASNVVAETASAGIAVRLAAGTPESVRKMIVSTLEDVKARVREEGGDLEIVWGGEGYAPVDMDCDVEGFETMTVNYGTDVPNLAGGHRRFLYGPGTIFVAHGDHEALTRRELEQAVLDYRRLIVAASKMHEYGQEEQVEL